MLADLAVSHKIQKLAHTFFDLCSKPEIYWGCQQALRTSHNLSQTAPLHACVCGGFSRCGMLINVVHSCKKTLMTNVTGLIHHTGF